MFEKIVIVVLSLLVVFCLIFRKRVRKKYRKIYMMFLFIVFILWIYMLVSFGLDRVNYHYSSEGSLSDITENVKTLEKEVEELKKEVARTDEELKGVELLATSLLNSYINEVQALKEEYEEKENSLEELKEQYTKLNDEYETLYNSSSFLLDNVTTYHQYPKYPNGCESVALYILLKYFDVDVTMKEIVDVLPKGSSPFYANGVRYAGDPEREFVGDPRLYTGYGVYQKPIISVANQFKEGIKDITGSSLSEVLDVLSTGVPVQVWVSINLKDTKVCISWLDEQTNKKIDWICNLHSLVVVGYDYKNIIVSDPYTGKIEYYEKKQFEKMYNLFGKRAIYYES